MAGLIHIIGGGLAGSEAAWQVAEGGGEVVLHEMRPHHLTPAHQTDGLAELVCSNSFRSDDARNNAVGLLHEEMRRAGSLILQAADAARVPAGSALAVDRDLFSSAVTEAIDAHPRIAIDRGAVDRLPPEDWQQVIVATGPLTSHGLGQAIMDLTGEESLAFFDAIAPIVYKESIDFETAWFQSRYDKGEGADYINCPLDKAQYEAFLDALLAADRTTFKDWERNTPYFEGCMPIEVMAERGRETLRYGPMKPVGLTDPRSGRRPYAVVQLRQDNARGTLYNIVGFQTKIRYKAQTDVFRMIPGLERARFARLGGIHRNTFLNSPRVLDATLRLRADCGPDHRRRGLCRIGGNGPACRPLRTFRASWRAACPAAAHHRPGRPALACHWGRECGDVSAHERQFRPVPAAWAQAFKARTQAGLRRPRARRSRLLAWRKPARGGRMTMPGRTGPSLFAINTRNVAATRISGLNLPHSPEGLGVLESGQRNVAVA